MSNIHIAFVSDLLIYISVLLYIKPYFMFLRGTPYPFIQLLQEDYTYFTDHQEFYFIASIFIYDRPVHFVGITGYTCHNKINRNDQIIGVTK